MIDFIAFLVIMGSIFGMGFLLLLETGILGYIIGFVSWVLGFTFLMYLIGNEKCKSYKKYGEKYVLRYLELSNSQNFSKVIGEEPKKYQLTFEECVSLMKSLEASDGSLTLFLLKSELDNYITKIAQGDFSEASEHMKKANDIFKTVKVLRPEHFGLPYSQKFGEFESDYIPKVLNFSAKACDALYLGDVEKMRELLNEAREMLDERDKFVIGDVKFFKYLFEFHYFLLKTVVETYEAEVGAVAKLAEKQAKRFAETKPVEVPAHVEKIAVSTEEPEKELYRGEVRFKMGAMSQERVGTLVITNKHLKLTGKYRLRGHVATVAVKAALRAAGVGEVYEEFPLGEIRFLELKKALLGAYYLEFRAGDKKFTLYTDAAQHIYNLLRQYTNA
ncbi:hypothetical protein JCM16138_03650 [Thermococcus atlanticus]